MKSQVLSGRVRMLFFIFVFFALILVLKLYIVQIVSGEEYSAKADRQYLRPSDSMLERGSIFFTRKDGSQVTAAHQETGFIIAINPPALDDIPSAYSKINGIVPVEEKVFLARADKKDDPYEEIAKKVSLADGERISSMEIPGVITHKQKWRFYPNKSLAAHVLGFMAFKENEYAGRYGLEKFYDDVLRRENESLYANFFVEIFSNIQKSISSNDNARGDIVTTIEPVIQAYFEQELEKINNKWSSEYSGGIIIDPKTGEIAAMAIYPPFNPNSFQNEDDASIYSNKLVESVYEMGSIIKPLTMAAGLDSGAVKASTTYYDSGTMTLNNKQISNFDGKGRGTVNMQEVLGQSLNTGVATVALKMGNKKFTEYMKAFGLGEKTGIDLPYEAAPLVSNLDAPRDLEHANASFGQGIAMTPVATVRALSALANGGTLITPHVVKEIKYKSGLSKKTSFPPGRQVIKKESADEISRMLVKVVDEALLGGTVKQEHYSIAAKTGTAQIARAGGYYDDRYLHSFFGYFPAYDAKFLVFLFTYHPKGVKYASETLTHSFIDITKYLINYYEIDPDR